MNKNLSILIPFDTMKENIRCGEKWVRNDWKNNDKYVILADERYCTPCLLLVFTHSNEYVIFKPTYNDFKYRWKRINIDAES